MTKDAPHRFLQEEDLNQENFRKNSSARLFDNLGLMTVEELAGSLGLSPKTIRNWVAKRQIPFISLNGRTMFRRATIEAWLIKKEVKPWE